MLYSVARLSTTVKREGTESMADPADLIWIQDAAKEYKRSRIWLDSQIDLGKLSTATIPGDKRLYLLRSELDALLMPHVQRREQGEGAG